MRLPERPLPTSIRLRPALKARLMEIAKHHRWRLAETIVYALEDWVLLQKRRQRR